MPRYIFKLPYVGEDIVQVRIITWHAQVGDWLNEDDPLLDVTIHNSTVELASPVYGTLAETHVAEGTTACVGELIAVFDVDASELSP